jgi:hypothetical protein
MMKALSSPETSFLTRVTCSNIPEDAILHSYGRENLKSYRAQTVYVGFEILTAATMKNVVLWDVTLCDTYKDRRFDGAYRLYHQGNKDQ